jgi:GNAT superfamily N-acetyltransferase
MREPTIAVATESELIAFAERRWRDESSQRLYRHLAGSAAWIARDEGIPVGIAFAHASPNEVYLSECYVEPAYRNGGIGASLYDALEIEGEDRATSALLDPADHATLAFFARRGLAAQTPVLRLAGTIPKEEELAALAHGAYRFRVETIDLSHHAGMLDALDRDVRGCERPSDHQLFTSASHGTAVFLDSEFVGYVYVWPDGRVGPIAVASPSYAVQMFALGLLLLVREHGASWCSAGIPGVNLRVVRAALRIGLKIDMGRIYATDRPAGDLGRYVGYHPLLF